VGRFVNHACGNNNLKTKAFLGAQKSDLLVCSKRIALISTRSISKGEELTYDYLSRPQEANRCKRQGKQGVAGIRCLCGEKGCRKNIWPAD
jgi:SET domain-containing protein